MFLSKPLRCTYEILASYIRISQIPCLFGSCFCFHRYWNQLHSHENRLQTTQLSENSQISVAMLWVIIISRGENLLISKKIADVQMLLHIMLQSLSAPNNIVWAEKSGNWISGKKNIVRWKIRTTIQITKIFFLWQLHWTSANIYLKMDSS